jgi:hypothetical protein
VNLLDLLLADIISPLLRWMPMSIEDLTACPARFQLCVSVFQPAEHMAKSARHCTFSKDAWPGDA